MRNDRTATRRSLVAAALAAGMACVAPRASARADQPPEEAPEAAATVTTTGTASKSADPDTADVSMGVYVEAPDAVECQNQAADLVDAVLAALDAAGFSSDHVTTENLNLFPTYDYSTDRPVVNGYRIEVSLNVVGVDASRVGEVVSVATGAGANQVYGASYYTSDFDELYRQALSDALDAARAKADVIASHESMTVLEVRDVVEGYENRVYRSASLSNFDVAAAEEAAYGAAASAKQVAVDPGAVEVSASVTVTYLMGPAA